MNEEKEEERASEKEEEKERLRCGEGKVSLKGG